MTNKFISMMDGIRQGIASVLTPRCHRSDSLSIVSRQSLLPIFLLCLTLFIGAGQMWGAHTLIKAGDMVSGEKYIITAVYNSTTYYLAPASFSTGGGSATAYTTSLTEAAAWTFTKSSSSWTISTKVNNTTYYLGNTNTNNGVQSTTTSQTWTIAESSSGSNTVKITGGNNRDLALYQSSNWRCYSSNSGVKTITLYRVDAESCTTNPTVSAGSNSAVTSTTATVSCTSGISSLGSAGCSISSYGFVIGSSSNPAIGGTGVTKHEVGTSYTTTGTSFSKNLTDLSPTTTYYIRPYATNGNGTAYGTQTSFTTLALPKYTVTLKDDETELEQATAGASVNLPSRTGCTGYTFAGWTKSWTSAQSSWTTTAPTIIKAGSYTPQADESLYPVYTKTEGGGPDKYQKVTSTEGITDGQYLIVYETGNVAMNGGLATFDAVGNTISVTISNSAIAVSSTTTAAEFTIDVTNQTIKGASDKYIDRTSGTSGGALNTITSNPASHALSIDNSGNFVDQASVTGTHSYLKYNNASNQTRFRYYTNGQQDIQLYKRVSSSTTSYISVPNCCTPLASINGSVF